MGLRIGPLLGWGIVIYANWSVWFGYALVALTPLLALYPRFNRFNTSGGV